MAGGLKKKAAAVTAFKPSCHIIHTYISDIKPIWPTFFYIPEFWLNLGKVLVDLTHPSYLFNILSDISSDILSDLSFDMISDISSDISF